MVVHLRLAVRVIVCRNWRFCCDVALELAAAGNIRNKDDRFLAGAWSAGTGEDLVRWDSQKA